MLNAATSVAGLERVEKDVGSYANRKPIPQSPRGERVVYAFSSRGEENRVCRLSPLSVTLHDNVDVNYVRSVPLDFAMVKVGRSFCCCLIKPV